MENSIEKIKKEIELKRKHNEETLKQLKEKSKLYNAQKEKQKNFFLKKTNTFLNKKRKLSDDNNNKDDINNKDNENEITNELINYTDYDDYYLDDVMNSSFMSTRTFNNLNFCRPERFSYKNKKKKLLIKNEEKFTINNTIKPKPTQLKKLSSFSITLSNEIKQNDNLKINNNNDNNSNKETNLKFGFISNSDNNVNNNKDNNTSLFDIKDNKTNSEIKKEGGLFGFSLTNNKGGLFTSNISDENKKEDKDNNQKNSINTNDDKNENKQTLFGNLDRLKNINKEGNSLFGPTPALTPTFQTKSELKLNTTLESPKNEEIKNTTINSEAETPKKNTLFNFGKEETKKEIQKEKVGENKKEVLQPISSNLFGNIKNNEEKKEENNNKDDKIKEKENNEKNKSIFGSGLFKFQENKENKSLFGDGLFKSQEKQENKKEEKETIGLFGLKEKQENKKEEKETIGLFGLKEKQEDKKEQKEQLNLFGLKEIKEEKKEQKENIKSNENKSLFGNIFNKDEEKPKEIGFSLFNTTNTPANTSATNTTGLFGFQEKKVETNNILNDDKNISLFGPKNNEKENNINNSNNDKENNPIINTDNTNKIEEKSNSSVVFNSKGSLASDASNPFLNPVVRNDLPNIFSANNLSNNKSSSTNTINNSNSIFTSPSLFGVNNVNKEFVFNPQPMGNSGMDMSPTMNARNLFNNTNPTNNINNNSLFNSNPNRVSLFGQSNNTSLFSNNNNNNGIFMNNNGGLFGNQSSGFSGRDKAFSLGVKNTSIGK